MDALPYSSHFCDLVILCCYGFTNICCLSHRWILLKPFHLYPRGEMPPTSRQMSRRQFCLSKAVESASRSRTYRRKNHCSSWQKSKRAGLRKAPTSANTVLCWYKSPLMRVKRLREHRRNIAFFRTALGFRPPFKVLCDGNFIHHCILVRLAAPDTTFPKLLGAPTRVYTTRYEYPLALY